MKSTGKFFWVVCALLFFAASASAQEWDWVQRFSSDSSGTAIGVDGEQNVYVAGTFTGTNYLGTNRFVSANGSAAFLLKFNPDGEVVWIMTLGGYIGCLVISSMALCSCAEALRSHLRFSPTV